MKILTDQLNNRDVLNQLGATVGANESQVKKLTELGIPTLLQALERNSSTSEGAESLATALDEHEDVPVDDLKGLLYKVNKDDGAKILKHIFSGNDDQIENNLAQTTGLEKNQVSSMLAQLAPFLMGALGQQKKQQNIDSNGITDLLSNVLRKNSNSGMQDIVKNILDSNKDGNILDEVGNILGSFMKKR